MISSEARLLPSTETFDDITPPPFLRRASQTNISDVHSLMLDELRDLKDVSRRLADDPPLKFQTIWTSVLQFFGLLAALLFGVFAVLAWKEARASNVMAQQNNEDTARAYDLALRAHSAALSANELATRANSLGSIANQYASRGLGEVHEANKLAILDQCQSILALPASTADPNFDICVSVQAAFSSSLARYASTYFASASYSVSEATTSAAGTQVPSTTRTGMLPTTTRPASTVTKTASATSPAATSTTTVPSPDDSQDSKDGLSGGAIAGTVIGSIFGFALLVAASALPYFAYREKMKRSQDLRNFFEGKASKAG